MPGVKDVDRAHVRVATDWARREFDDEAITNISEVVYRLRLESGDLGERMVREDKDDGAKLRARAGGYNSITRDVLKSLKLLGYMT